MTTTGVVIVTGEGRGFCAGADLASGGDAFSGPKTDDGDTIGPDSPEVRDTGGMVTMRIFDLKKPIIAAINGPAVGIGITMTLPMDIRLVSEKAKIGFVFAQRGIVPEAASSWFLPRLVGVSQALEWGVTGRVFPASEALAGGLVKEVLAPEELMPRALEIAREIVENTSPVSVALIRQMMWKMLTVDHPVEAHKLDSRLVFLTGRSGDAKEGVLSFLEKRRARFPGKPSQDMPEIYPWWEPRNYS